MPPDEYEITFEDTNVKRLQKLMNGLRKADIYIISLKIEVISPDERVYGFQPWYPITVKKKGAGGSR